jgi:ABC-type polar amino acid transport system ATPase subunit
MLILVGYAVKRTWYFSILNLFPHLAALDNYTLALKKVKGMAKEGAEQKVVRIL